jgi:hypothetical protein
MVTDVAFRIIRIEAHFVASQLEYQLVPVFFYVKQHPLFIGVHEFSQYVSRLNQHPVFVNLINGLVREHDVAVQQIQYGKQFEVIYHKPLVLRVQMLVVHMVVRQLRQIEAVFVYEGNPFSRNGVFFLPDRIQISFADFFLLSNIQESIQFHDKALAQVDKNLVGYVMVLASDFLLDYRFSKNVQLPLCHIVISFFDAIVDESVVDGHLSGMVSRRFMGDGIDVLRIFVDIVHAPFEIRVYQLENIDEAPPWVFHTDSSPYDEGTQRDIFVGEKRVQQFFPNIFQHLFHVFVFFEVFGFESRGENASFFSFGNDEFDESPKSVDFDVFLIEFVGKPVSGIAILIGGNSF